MEKKLFAARGVLHLKGLVSNMVTSKVKKAIVGELERTDARKKLKGFPVFQQTTRLGQMVKVGEEAQVLFPSALLKGVEILSSGRIEARASIPQLLLSLPHRETWSLKALNWHLDLAIPKQDEVPGIQAFVLIDDVAPRGGSTLAIAGSHRLPYTLPGRILNPHAVLRESESFAPLFAEEEPDPEAFFASQSVNGIPVSVVEMCGKAGDVYLMDMRVLHSPSINSSKQVRMMATLRWTGE